MRLLEKEQTNEERYQYFLEREREKRGKIIGWFSAQLFTAWARITEEELGIPLEPGEIRGELKSEQIPPKAQILKEKSRVKKITH